MKDHAAYVDEIVPGLYLGSKHVRIDFREHISFCFTHVVDASNKKLPKISSIPVYYVRLTDSAYSQLPLDEVSEFIQSALEPADGVRATEDDDEIVVVVDEVKAQPNTSTSKGANVLVHCNQGVSRSAALVMAYLIKAHGHTLKKAFFHVQSKRQIAMPNPGFMKQLIEFERKHHNGETTLNLGFGGTLLWKKGLNENIAEEKELWV